jgi:uncharacterized RDD family membrane protein YckC
VGGGIATLASLAARVAGVTAPDSGTEAVLFWLVALPIVWCYFAVAESSSLQSTCGQRALGMIVTDKSGRPIGLGRATARLLLNVLSVASFGVGYLMIAFMPKKQALHDWIAGTLVLVSSNNANEQQRAARDIVASGE